MLVIIPSQNSDRIEEQTITQTDMYPLSEHCRILRACRVDMRSAEQTPVDSDISTHKYSHVIYPRMHFFCIFLDQELAPYCCSSCSSCSCWSVKPKSQPFQIGSGRNVAGLFLKWICITWQNQI